MKASDLFVQCLEQEGVEVIFGIPGVETLDLMESLSKSKIRFITARHESSAAFMADVYARVSGRVGVCLSAAGAASTNMVTALASATMDHAPIVALTGQRSLSRIYREPGLTLDIVSTLQPVTKWNTQIKKPEFIPSLIHKAFKIARTETLGACHLDFPEDVASEEVTGRPFPAASLRRPSPPDRILDGAAELIDESKTVVILAGHGAVRGDASQELIEFVEEIGLPVISTSEGMGILPFDHPNYWYTIDIHSEEECLTPLRQADLVITVGYELDEFPPDLWNPEGRVKIIHMSASPFEISHNYMVEVEIIGDIRDSLRNLKMMIREPKKLPDANGYKLKRIQVLKDYSEDNSYPVKPQRVLSDLAKVLRPEDLLVCDMGTHRFWLSQYFPAPGPGSVILSQSQNAKGFALPGAIGARIAQPQRRIIALSGDGGFLPGSAELSTASNLGFPIVVLLLNDNHMGYIRSLQLKRFNNSIGTDLKNPDFVALAKSHGAEGILLEKGGNLAELLEKAMESDKPTLIEVPIDANENQRIFEHCLRSI